MPRLQRPLFVLIFCASGIALFGAVLSAIPVAVTVEWSTASELNTAGFNLYRGDSPTGPYVRVNAELIPASTDPLIGGAYIFTDTQVAPGRTYYYRLEEVETNGATSEQGVVTVTAVNNLTLMVIVVAVGILVGAGLLFGRRRNAPAAS